MAERPEIPLFVRTAFDVKSIHRGLADEFRDDELKRIPLLPRGQRLEQGATYHDLCSGNEFTALANQVVERDDCMVAKSEVDYQLWNRLRGVTVPAPASGGPRRTRVACANCDVPIVDPIDQVVHGDKVFCCPNCAEAMEQAGSGSDPRALRHDEDPRCAHCDSPIVYRKSMVTIGDKVFCCNNCAQAVSASP